MKPDGAYCAGSFPGERLACLAPIRREPEPWTAKNSGNAEWPPETSIDPMLPDPLQWQRNAIL